MCHRNAKGDLRLKGLKKLTAGRRLRNWNGFPKKCLEGTPFTIFGSQTFRKYWTLLRISNDKIHRSWHVHFCRKLPRSLKVLAAHLLDVVEVPRTAQYKGVEEQDMLEEHPSKTSIGIRRRDGSVIIIRYSYE